MKINTKWDIEAKERFLSRIEKDDKTGCWNWTGSKLKTGYGTFSAKRSTGKCWRAHRFSWIIHGKELVEGLDLCHSCDNRLCVNPDHLWLGTRQENLLDCLRKNRNPNWNKTHCKHGHEYTKENTMIRYDGDRECRTCSNRHKKEWHERNKHIIYA